MRLRPLDRKLLRDLWRTRWQSLAVAMLIACGIAVAVMAHSSREALESAKDRYYSQTRFADVFARAVRAPLSVAERLRLLDGVVAVDARVVQAGLMDVPGLVRPAVSQVISLPEEGDPGLNAIVMRRGRLPARAGEAVALETFLDAAKVKLGDRLSVTLRGRRADFIIVGAALSPEYIYVPGSQSMLPDEAHQAVLWAQRAVVERTADLDGAFNAVALKLAPGASEAAVRTAVDRALAPYGGAPAVAREHQLSNAIVEAELNELATTARVVPPIFLLVAAALIHMVLGRMVEVEREQVGLLKAFGYRNREVAGFYVRLALAVGVLGALLGGLLGAGMGAVITDLYAEYMRFPALQARFDGAVFALTSGIGIGAAVAGSLSAALQAARLAPAVALQPPRPPSYSPGLLERLGLSRLLDQPSRILLRNLARFRSRSLLTAAGLAASLSLLIGMQFMFGSIDQIIDQAYYQAQRWSHSVAFAEPRDVRAVSEISRLPGVYGAEPFRAAPARIHASGLQETIVVNGLQPQALLARPLNESGAPLPFPGPGVILSEALALKLHVRPGELVTLEFLERTRRTATMAVTGLATDYSGFAAYVPLRALNRILGEADVAGGAHLLVARDAEPAFYDAVERTPMLVGAASRDDTVANWRTTMSESFRITMSFQVTFASAIAFGVAFNVGRITLAERSRDLATLRVLGFSPAECAYILLGELAVLALLALPFGVGGGTLLAKGIAHIYAREEMRLPDVVTARTYAICLTAYLLAVTAAAALVGRRIWGLDLVSVLKTRE